MVDKGINLDGEEVEDPENFKFLVVYCALPNGISQVLSMRDGNGINHPMFFKSPKYAVEQFDALCTSMHVLPSTMEVKIFKEIDLEGWEPEPELEEGVDS